MEDGSSTSVCTLYGQLSLTQPVRTLFLFKFIWTRPQGSQGCQKIRFIFLQIKLLSFCAIIAPDTNFKKSSRLEKMSKTPVFLDSNDPPQKNSESLYCITSYIISCCILGNNKRPIDLSRIVKTGRKCSKLVKTGNDLTVGF